MATRRTDWGGSLPSETSVDRETSPPAAPPWSEECLESTGPTEPDAVLLEFDRLEMELRSRRPLSRPVLPEGLESPYLEERLAVAQATVAHLGREIGALWPRSVPIQQTVATLEAELACARREFDFLRARESAPAVSSGTPLLLLPSPQRGIPTSGGAIRRGPEGRRSRWGEQGTFAPPGTVAWFTARRYNRTIGRIKSRRRRLAGVTFTLAIAVSVLLLALTLYFRESSPPLWIALLPAIWLVSVPFFVFSFRGTQRVLRRNHLELDREP